VRASQTPYVLRMQAVSSVPFDWGDPDSVKPVNRDEFKNAFELKPRETLFFDENSLLHVPLLFDDDSVKDS
jgi:hypothetical protein